MGDRRVQRDFVNPSGEFRFSLEQWIGLPELIHDVLEDIFALHGIAGKIGVANPVDNPNVLIQVCEKRCFRLCGHSAIPFCVHLIGSREAEETTRGARIWLTNIETASLSRAGDEQSGMQLAKTGFVTSYHHDAKMETVSQLSKIE